MGQNQLARGLLFIASEMKLVTSICLLSLLLPVAAAAQTSKALFDEISSRRVDIERIEEARSILSQERERLVRALEAGAQRIQRHKETHDAGGIIPDLDLQRMLAESRELSEQLAELNRQLDSLENAKRMARANLLSRYEKLVERLAEEARRSEGRQRDELLNLLSRVRLERDDLRENPEAAPLPAERFGGDSLLGSEDPEELAERADAVRDEQDRLRRELSRLDRALAQQQADRRLDMEMRDFLSERSVFGEDSRTLRTGGSSSSAKTNSQGSDRDTPPVGFEGGGSYDSGTSGPGAAGVVPTDSVSARTPMAIERDGISPAGQAASGGASAVETRRRQIVERLKKLQVLHDRLRDKAEALLGEQP